MLTHIPTIALLSTALITITLYVSKWGAKVIPEWPTLIYGDFPHVPEGARAATRELKLGGGSELRKQRPGFAQVIAHDSGGL